MTYSLLAFIFFINKSSVNCYYSFPLKIASDQELEFSSDNKDTFYYLLENKIYTEIEIGSPAQTLAAFIKSKNYCTYIASNICNIENSDYQSDLSADFENLTDYILYYKDFDHVCLAKEQIEISTDIKTSSSNDTKAIVPIQKFYYAPYNQPSEEYPNTCGVFGFKYKIGEDEEQDNQCINLLDNLKTEGDESSLTYKELFGDKTNISSMFSIQYFESKKEENKTEEFEGRLVVGELPHVYDSENYDEKYFKKIKMNDSYNEYYLLFNDIYYYKGNKKDDEKQKVHVNDTESLESFIVLEQKMITTPKEFFENLVTDFFDAYIQESICEQKFVDNLYQVIVCKKGKLFSTKAFYDNFPSVFFFHDEFNFTFELTGKELFEEKDEKIYFMMYVDVNSDKKWIFGRKFLEKYLFNFNLEENTIGFYSSKGKYSSEFNFLDSGIYVIIILVANILTMLGCCFYGIIAKCTKSKVDPTIMIDSFSAPAEYLKKDLQESPEEQK